MMQNFKPIFLISVSLFLCFLLLYLSTSFSYADELSELKRQLKQLQKRIEALEKKAKEKPAEVVLEEEEVELPGVIDIPKLKIKGFADIGWSSEITANEDTNTFSLGAIDLFITSEITDKVSFLTEQEFHFNTGTNSGEFHLERANLKYSISDLFNIKLGRMHMPLGYWNTTFHHGTWLQTSVFRPEIYIWEDDDGGFLPVHSVGVEVLGVKEFERFDWEYNFSILNGRGRTKTEIQNVRDKNDSKAVNLLLSVKPHFLEGLKLGTNIYYDKIPSNPSVSTRTSPIDELILGSYFTYRNENLELLAELFNIYHNDHTTGKDFDTLAFYLQGSYRTGKLIPYYRFDFIDFGDGDPYFTPDALDIKKHTLGLRWDVSSWNALKFEYSFSKKEAQSDKHSITVNSSFAF